MAVSIKNASNFFLKLGIPQSSVDSMTALGIGTNLGFFDLRFVDGKGNILCHVKLIRSTNEIMKGLPSLAEVAKIREAVIAGMQLAAAAVPLPSTPGKEESVSFKVKVEAESPQPKLDPSKAPAATPEMIKHATAVPLKDATIMYQPVRGTDASSRYFVVAMNDRVKVAARVMAGKVSIRAEGDFTPSEMTGLMHNGLTNHDGKYLSGHFNFGGINPSRVIGAVLMGSGISFVTPMPDLKLIS